MGTKVTSEKVMSNVIWRFAERFGAQLVTFAVTLILARILDPEVYGTVALVTVFISILQVFVDGGLGNALIQKKDADDLDFSTVFYANLVFCAVLYLLLFFCAPLIAVFFDNPELTALTRVLGVVILISGVKNIQQAYVSRHFIFKKFFFATLFGTVSAAAVGIWMAVRGYGVWAVVAQHILNTAIDTLMLWFTVKWRPRAAFSFERFKGLYSFGIKLLGSNLLIALYKDLRQLVIGKMYSKADLAYYNKGKRFPYLIIKNINTSLNSVMFPTMSAVQDEKEKHRRVAENAIRACSYVIIPMMVGMAIIAEPLIVFLITDKWLAAVPFLQMYCFIYALEPMITANNNSIKSVGASDRLLQVTVLSKVIGVVALLITMWISPMAIAIGEAVCQPITWAITAWFNKRLTGYSLGAQIKDMLPYLGLSLIMGIPVYLIGLLELALFVKLVLQIAVGVGVYLLISVIFKVDMYYMLKKYLKKIMQHKAKGAKQ